MLGVQVLRANDAAPCLLAIHRFLTAYGLNVKSPTQAPMLEHLVSPDWYCSHGLQEFGGGGA